MEDLYQNTRPRGLQFDHGLAELDPSVEVYDADSLLSVEAVVNVYQAEHHNTFDSLTGKENIAPGFDGTILHKAESFIDSVDTPRGLPTWALTFEEQLASTAAASSVPNEMPVAGKYDSSTTLTSASSAAISSFQPEPVSLQIQPPIAKTGSASLKSKCEKARIDNMLRTIGWKEVEKDIQTDSSESVPLNPIACVPQENGVPLTAQEIRQARARERKIRNRASVQRCRERKLKYYEDLEKEKVALDVENNCMAKALASVEALIGQNNFMQMSWPNNTA